MYTLLSCSLSPALALLSLGLVSTVAEAEMVAVPAEPAFSQADRAVIARNETLRSNVEAAPWLVYRLLRDLDTEQTATRDFVIIMPSGDTPRVDPKRDPDLEPLPRASAEAAQDLFALIKQASTRPK